jgi:hypothetical protein
MKQIAKEMKASKVRNYAQTKALKEKMNVMEHKRKLAIIQYTPLTRKKGKEDELKWKQEGKKNKFQGGSNQIVGVLHGELQKQAMANGGYVPNPGTTILPLVSTLSIVHSINMTLTTMLFYTHL